MGYILHSAAYRPVFVDRRRFTGRRIPNSGFPMTEYGIDLIYLSGAKHNFGDV
jgi:hypothetical protein